jgi:ankyrin repeat protein
MTLLHAVARYDPPLTIVAKMIEICPELPSAVDCLDRTPLHIAAGQGASPALIKLIALACPAACDAQDEDGKTPLHLACDSSCELFVEDDANNNKPTSRRTPNHDSIRALLSESLHAATIEDLDEMSPLEYAIVSNASIQTVKMLQRAAAVSLLETPSRSNRSITSSITALPVSRELAHRRHL